MRRLNVLIILETLNLGGAQTHVVTLSKALTLKGHNISIVSAGGELVEKLASFGVKHYQLPLDRKSMLPYSTLHLVRIIREEKISVVHAHPRLKPILTGYLASAFFHIPFVTTVHGIFPTLFNYRYLDYIAERVIAVSSEVKNHLIDNCKIKEDNIEVIYNGVDLNQFKPLGETEYRHSNNHGVLKILYISRLDREKISAVVNLIEALPIIYSEISDFRLVIVGTGTEFDKIQSFVKKKNKQIGKELIFMFGGSKDVAGLIQSADIVIGVGRVILEAMACGKPAIVVGYSIGNHGGNFGGIVTQGNLLEMKEYNFSGRNSSDITSPGNISSSLIKLAVDENKRLELGVFGRKFVEKELSIDKMAKQTEKLYMGIYKKM